MGKTEFIIIIVAVVFVSLLFMLYFYNSKRMKAKKEQSETKDNSKVDSAPKTEKTLTKSEQKELEKAKEDVKSNIKDIMENISVQSENYIKSLNLKDEQNNANNQVTFQEVSNEELLIDEKAEEEAAIILGIKKKSVHVFDEQPEPDNADYTSSYNNDYDDYETSSSILNKLDTAEEATISKASSEIQLENFEEDDSVAEEFQDLSSRMKIMMMTDVFKRKYGNEQDNENRED